MSNKLLLNAFESTKYFVWKYTYEDPAKMLIGMAAMGFVLSSMAQCFAIKINDKIDKKKKNFMLAQETADGVVNIGLFLGITSSIWKISDHLIKFLGIRKVDGTKTLNLNLHTKNPIKSGGRILTTTIASVAACNIVTPFVRNIIAGKLRNHFEKKEIESKKVLLDIKKSENLSPFKNFDSWALKTIEQRTDNKPYPPSFGYKTYNGSLKI